MSKSDASYTDGELLGAYVVEYRQLEGASKQGLDSMVQSLTPPFKMAARRCDDLREASVQCYREHPDDVFLCRDSVQQFAQCAKSLFADHAGLVEHFQKLREEHKQQQQQGNAPRLP